MPVRVSRTGYTFWNTLCPVTYQYNYVYQAANASAQSMANMNITVCKPIEPKPKIAMRCNPGRSLIQYTGSICTCIDLLTFSGLRCM